MEDSSEEQLLQQRIAKRETGSSNEDSSRDIRWELISDVPNFWLEEDLISDQGC